MKVIVQDIRAEVVPDHSASLGKLDPERQEGHGVTWEWVGVRAVGNVLIELEDGRVALQDIQTPGIWAIASDNTEELEEAKTKEMATLGEMIVKLLGTNCTWRVELLEK